ncbi:hypothetical protein V7O61_08295 [Methanolobus sp. WCC1]|jgi:hypothetical protein|uniref:hypothetical protein n=1 Tax=unclassified Methanolobus TaxID=2629569 RepID=UPI003247B139
MSLPENIPADDKERQRQEDDDVGYITWIQTWKTAFASFFVGVSLFPVTVLVSTFYPDSGHIITHLAKLLLVLPIPAFVITVLLYAAERHEIKQFAIKYRGDE